MYLGAEDSVRLQVCALWHPDVILLPGSGCEVVDAIEMIKTERWGATCAVCGLDDGAVVKCAQGPCHVSINQHFNP